MKNFEESLPSFALAQADRARLSRARALIEAARGLADDLENPEAEVPALGKGKAFTADGPSCAFGHALHRAGHRSSGEISGNTEALYDYLQVSHYTTLPSDLKWTVAELADANDKASTEDRRSAVVKPLRTFAHTLEAFISAATDQP